MKPSSFLHSDPLDQADQSLLRLFEQIDMAREMMRTGEESTSAIYDFLSNIEQRADEVYTDIGMARETTRQAVELSDKMLAQRHEAVAAYRAILAQLRAMRGE